MSKVHDHQLVETFMRSPETGKPLCFTSEPIEKDGINYFRLQDSNGNDWTLIARLDEGWEECSAPVQPVKLRPMYQEMRDDAVEGCNKAIATIRAALDEALAAIREALAEPVKQEPVAWHEPNAYGNVTTHKKWAEENGWLPLYTKE